MRSENSNELSPAYNDTKAFIKHNNVSSQQVMDLIQKVKQRLSPGKSPTPDGSISGMVVSKGNLPHAATGGNVTLRYEQMEESMEWWKGRAYLNEQNAMRLQRELDNRIGRRGRGKNKQTFVAADSSHLSNIHQLKTCTIQTIWPQNKLLNFNGRWTRYDTEGPHSFADYVMKQVVIPQTFSGSANDYYVDVALPVVAAKLSSMRGNFVTKCSKSFKGE